MKRFFLLTVSVLLFGLCLTQPAVEFEKVCTTFASPELKIAGLWNEPLGPLEIMRGLNILILGAIGVLFIQYGAFGWLANPLYFAALFTSFKSRGYLPKLFAMGSLGIALVSLWLTNWFPLLANSGGFCHFSAIQPKRGYWLWLLAIALLNVHLWVSTSHKPIKPTAER
ncbi:hypothetical protein [Anabaena sp. CCY 0017]|uniref:hypothetical protein n=1 Tax=Anabaena sp. CCY 0017 TaxID=3103866 RepID=UPI0039C620CB